MPRNSTWFDLADRCVFEGYRTGFVQSFILHVALLLFLALAMVQPPTTVPPVMLALQFSAPPDAVVDQSPPTEIAPPADEAGAPATDGEVSLGDAVVDLPVGVDIELEDRLAGRVDARVTDDFDLPLTDLLAEVPSARSVPAEPAVLRHAARAAPGSSQGGLGTGPAGAGIDGELGRRLAAAGAQTGDVQVSIRWDDLNDIDVHVSIEPLDGGPWSMINWMTRVGLCGGMLDVDANAIFAMATPRPVENIFWGKGQAPFGRYTIAVHHYRRWAGPAQTPVEVAVLVDGKVQRFHPVVTFGAPPVVVTSFVRPLPRAVPR